MVVIGGHRLICPRSSHSNQEDGLGTYLIVDISCFYVKYYHVNRENNCVDGGISGFTYFLELLYRNIRDFKHIYFVLDTNKEFHDKKESYTDYKSGRENKDKIFENFNDFLTLLTLYPNSSIVRNPLYEADDVIAALALMHGKANKVIVYSVDKDMIQLNGKNENIKVSNQYKQGKFIELSDEDIFNKFKNSKKQNFSEFMSDRKSDIIKYRTFKGDSSDNIKPAIYKLPEKTIKYIINIWEEDYLDDEVLGNIILRTEDMSLRHKIAEHFDNILLNYKLMDLTHCNTDHKLMKNIKKIKLIADKDKILTICSKFGLNRFKDFLLSEGLV